MVKARVVSLSNGRSIRRSLSRWLAESFGSPDAALAASMASSGEDGTPISRDALARAVHLTRTHLDRYLTELIKCRTLSLREEDGALGFAKFGRWQETRNAKYNRTARKSAHDDAHSVQPRVPPRVQQTVDDRRQTTELSTQANPPTPASGGRQTRRKAPNPGPDVLAVRDAIYAARAASGLPKLSASQRDATTIAARLSRGATLDECLAVVAAFGRLVQREPDKRTVLNATTPFTGPSGSRSGGWAWGMGMRVMTRFLRLRIRSTQKLKRKISAPLTREGEGAPLGCRWV